MVCVRWRLPASACADMFKERRIYCKIVTKKRNERLWDNKSWWENKSWQIMNVRWASHQQKNTTKSGGKGKRQAGCDQSRRRFLSSFAVPSVTVFALFRWHRLLLRNAVTGILGILRLPFVIFLTRTALTRCSAVTAMAHNCYMNEQLDSRRMNK